VHIRRTPRMVASRSRVIRVTAALLLLGGIVPGVATTSAAAQLRPAVAQTTGTQLAQDYLSALTPAGAKFEKVEAPLKALGSSAPRPQVLAAVVSLGPALAPVEALLSAPLQPRWRLSGSSVRTTHDRYTSGVSPNWAGRAWQEVWRRGDSVFPWVTQHANSLLRPGKARAFGHYPNDRIPFSEFAPHPLIKGPDELFRQHLRRDRHSQ
jgi:hypothetical protein